MEYIQINDRKIFSWASSTRGPFSKWNNITYLNKYLPRIELRKSPCSVVCGLWYYGKDGNLKARSLLPAHTSNLPQIHDQDLIKKDGQIK